jgi:hypothetical protein
MNQSLNDIFIKKISEEKRINLFYAGIVHNIYEEIQTAIQKNDRAIFFKLPTLRYGEALENPNIMASEIKRILTIDNIQSFLVKKNSDLMYIYWENKMKHLKENENKYGAKSLNDFVEKHRH